jgi:uncharacterized protein
MKLGISAMIGGDFADASRPLFENNEIDVLEWSFDTAWGAYDLAPEVARQVELFSDAGQLIGHGVHYSLLSADEQEYHQIWLNRLKQELKHRNYRRITEHFGFMRAGRFRRNTPLPVPYREEFVKIGVENLKKLTDVVRKPIGLENFAFAFCMDDIKNQGEFLDKVLSPTDGHLVLDLHNLHCQVINFKVEFIELIKSLPLTRVNEIHISGGSWWEYQNKQLRRDSHNEGVPEQIWEILPQVLKLCPNLDTIIYERIGSALSTKEEKLEFVSEFRRLKKLINGG